MDYECSECLCIAIESHRPALLKLLLEPPNVVYRDMFWARQPIRLWCDDDGNKNDYPILHEISDDTDLSLVGRENCGHTPVDVELLLPLTDDTTERVLVSLPMLAQWHSTSCFNAEKMLRDSGKFDFSELQLAHTRTKGFFYNGRERFLNCSVLAISIESNKCAHGARKFSTDPMCSLLFSGTHVTGRCFINPDMFHLELQFHQMEIPPMFCDILSNGLSAINNSGVCSDVHLVQRQIDNGADLNAYMSVLCAIKSRKAFELKFSLKSRFSGLEYYGLVSYLCMCCSSINMSHSRNFSDKVHFDSFQLLLITLLRNGFSVFLDEKDNFYEFPLLTDSNNLIGFDVKSLGFLGLLIQEFGIDYLKFSRNICKQLLALGYGRRELHPQGVPLYDENLEDTRQVLQKYKSQLDSDESISSSDSDKSIIAAELQAILDAFDAGPLSLLQLSRIAVRRAIGGVHFARHMKALSSLLPPLLYDYVADPTELLNSDSQSNILAL